MIAKYTTAALLGVALFSAPALAQSTSTTTSSSNASNSQTVFMKAGEWRAFKLDGLDVYNNNNDKVGDIKEIIMGQNGNVDSIVIGVGGFLGMGEHYVALPLQDVKFVMEPRNSNGTAANTSTSRTTTGSGATMTTTTTTSSNATRDYPDHAVINMTKDQLKAAPEFKFNSDKR